MSEFYKLLEQIAGEEAAKEIAQGKGRSQKEKTKHDPNPPKPPLGMNDNPFFNSVSPYRTRLKI